MPSLYEYKAWARNLLARAGWQKRRKADRLVGLLKRFDVELVFDVGANSGQFGRHLRSMGYEGRLVSFEPLSEAFHRLQANAFGIPQWQPVQLAIGDYDGEATIHVAGNSQSSSLLQMLPRHVAAAPKSAYVGVEAITVRRLDTICNQFRQADEPFFIKLDVQGFEHAVLCGAQRAIQQCVGIQLEMAMTPLYEGEVLFFQMLAEMQERGFALMSLPGGFTDTRTGELLQVDGLFVRRELLESRLLAA
jgi:FkbM family methyltransferase